MSTKQGLLAIIFEEAIKEHFNQDVALTLNSSDIDFIFEVFEPNAKILPDVENVFEKVKKQAHKGGLDQKTAKEMFKIIDKFYKGKLKEFKIVTNENFFNAYVFAEYSKKLFSKKIFQPGAKPDLDDIKGIYIGFGLPLIKKLTPRECVAVLLHETGHVLQHTVQASVWMKLLLRIIAFESGLPNILRTIVSTLLFGVHSLFVIICLATFIFGRTLYFTEHLAEYDADRYAVKYGYGEELISVLQKIREFTDKKSAKTYVSKIKALLKSLLHLVFSINPTHPLPERRICNIIKELNKMYDNHYEIKSKKVKEILKYVQC